MGFPQAGLWAMARSLFTARLFSELRLNLLAYPVYSDSGSSPFQASLILSHVVYT
jgi:hypothetical protein